MSNTSPTPLSRALTAYHRLTLPKNPVIPARNPPPVRLIYLTPAQLEELADAYLHGATVYDLAAKYSVNRRSVSKHLKQMGIRLNGSRLYEPELNRAKQLHDEGLRPPEIASILGKPEILVWRVVRGRTSRITTAEARQTLEAVAPRIDELAAPRD